MREYIYSYRGLALEEWPKIKSTLIIQREKLSVANIHCEGVVLKYSNRSITRAIPFGTQINNGLVFPTFRVPTAHDGMLKD